MTSRYLDIFIFLISTFDNVRVRGIILKKNLRELEGKIQDMERRISAECGDVDPDNREISAIFKDIHYSQLEVILRINVLIELLAVYYRIIRASLTTLPKSIGKKDFPANELHKEFNYFSRQSLTEIWENYKYPNVSKFSDLSNEEQRDLNVLLQQSALEIQNYFQKIFLFQGCFRTVYNKYKHGLSELTGTFGIDKLNKKIETHIFIRHKENNKFFTYIIPVSMGEVAYYEQISSYAYSLLSGLIDNTLLYLVNEGKDFIPRGLFVGSEHLPHYKEIADKIQSCIMPEFTSKMIVNPPNEKVMKDMNEAFQKKHIYRMNRDILDVDAILKQGMAIQGTS